MCDPFALISTGLQVASAVSERSAANKAAAAAARAANFNADIIERDIDLLEKTRAIMNENFLVMQTGPKMHSCGTSLALRVLVLGMLVLI